MHRVLLLGAGKIGRSIAAYLKRSGDYDVRVADQDQGSLDRLRQPLGVEVMKIDASSPASLERAMKDRQSVLSALTYALNPQVARLALKCGASYFDLTEDVATTKATKEISRSAKEGQIFVPQCGLAPGFVSIAAHELTLGFDKLDEVRLRVGALPIYPSNQLKYNLTWSTDGLINEYGNPCEAIHNGKMIDVLPLEGLERFSLDGVEYEAFNTSGGVGTLCETLDGRVRDLTYKTIRYPGHRYLMAFLMNELKLNDRREVVKDILEKSLPSTPQDVVIVFCMVSGWKNGAYMQVTDARKVYHGQFMGEESSAIQLTTACGVCAILDLHATGKLPKKGFVRQEQVRLGDFLENRFGKVYASHGTEMRYKSAD
jgi:saccharopine dehydrogenase-like NADP-dependent oxidoreductase